MWCVQVPSSYFVARRNGQVFITGNSGFPKSSDISKTIDKRADAEREVVGIKPGHEEFADRDTTGHLDGTGGGSEGWRRPWQDKEDADDYHKQTVPATDAAKEWDGWKTALKPATEFVVVARKPFDGATVDCVLEHGTGALNIDGCRVGTNPTGGHWSGGDEKIGDENLYSNGRSGGEHNPDGRYPSNVVFDEKAAEELDRNNEDTVSSGGVPDDGQKDDRHNFAANVQASTGGLGDNGGVSRYFYTSKASAAERTLNGRIENAHPTVKPGDLMEWLVRLVTREGQTVLDPFAGSGTTCRAAKELGREFVGIEKQTRWADVARVRCGLTPDDPSHVRSDDEQTGIEAYTDGGEP